MENNELVELIAEIDEVLALAKQGLLKQQEFFDSRQKAQNVLDKNIPQDSILWREYDKQKKHPVWTIQSRDGYMNDSQTGILSIWKTFAIKTLDLQGKQANKDQILIQKNQYFIAREHIRNILKNARNSIEIQDNYINNEILSILSEFVEENPTIQVKILTQKVSEAFISSMRLFEKQYGVKIQLKLHENCHDRFLIIDRENVYHSGHSFKDLASKASLVTNIKDDAEKQKVINEFDSWWQSGKYFNKNERY